MPICLFCKGGFVNLENVYTNLTQIIQITRRVQGTILCSLLLVLVLTGCGSQVVDSSRVDTVVAGKSEDFRVSLSVSPFTEGVMSSGTVFTDGEFTAHTPEQLQQLFIKYGANEVYARISTTRVFVSGNQDHSINRGLERAALAKALNLPFNPELGLFKSYGDITHQPSPDFTDYPQLKLPGEWISLTLDQMLPILRSYGKLVAQEILDTGVKVRIWDLGNEVEFGVAGVAINPGNYFGDVGKGQQEVSGYQGYQSPDGIDPEIGRMSISEIMEMEDAQRIAWLEVHLWPYIGEIFAAVAQGIESVDENARFSTHVSPLILTSPAQAIAFFKTLKKHGYFPDELGFSFYPTSSTDSLKAFKETALAVHREFGRPIFIAEYGYPAGEMTGQFSWNASEENYPLTPEGQAAFTNDLIDWGVETGILSGIRPWGPDLTEPGWEPMSLFSQKGKTAIAKPVLSTFVDVADREKTYFFEHSPW